ncbi:MAG: stage II sporulation protein M [Fimbriimonadaceae bacterium]|nr:stage II sporulation protein M [Fimbriimonadaceae bacterium]
MTVEQFVAARQQRWQQLSACCDQLQTAGSLAGPGLRQFGPLYRQTTGDLAYAAVHLPDPELLAWLNRLCARAHSLLYAAPRRAPRRRADWLTAYPARWRAAAPFLLVSTALFAAATLLAFVTVYREPTAARLFVPGALTADLAVDPSGQIPPGVFVALTGFLLTNNLTAALVAFAGGIFLGLGSLAALLRNGFLLGGLAGLATAQGGGLDFLAAVAPHGVLELPALLTVAAAGLQLGWAVLHGGRRSRLRALAQTGPQAFTLLGGGLGGFVLAALVEGLLTPWPAPAPLKLLLALVLAALLAYYLTSGRGRPDDALDALPADPRRA